MHEICLTKNIQKTEFHDLTHFGDRELVEGQNEEILKFVPSRLLKSPT